MTTQTLHSSHFDVSHLIHINIATIVSPTTSEPSMTNSEIGGFIVTGNAVSSVAQMVIGAPAVSIHGHVAADASNYEYIQFSRSSFGIYLDREQLFDCGVRGTTDFEYPIININQDINTPAILNADAIAAEYDIIHKSKFTIWENFEIDFNASLCADSAVGDATTCIGINSGVAAKTSIVKAGVGVKFVIDSGLDLSINDIFGGIPKYDLISSCVCQPISITAEYVAPNQKSIIFGSYSLPHAERKSDDGLKLISNDKFKWIKPTPRVYERTILIHGETDQRADYDSIVDLIGQKWTLNVHGFVIPDCECTDVSIKQTKPGLNRYPYSATFIQRVFDEVDTASFAGHAFSHVVGVGEDKKTGITNEKFKKAGVSEPSAYSVMVTIDCITESKTEYDNLELLFGSVQDLVINGNTYANSVIADISGIQQIGGGSAWAYSISFTRLKYYGTDVVTFDSVSIPNISEIGEIKRSQIVNDNLAKSGIGEPKAIQATLTIDGILTSVAQYTALDALIGDSGVLSINGIEYTGVRISDISYTLPRGGNGEIRAYSLSMSWYEFSTSDSVSFDTITCQNVISVGELKRVAISDERYSKTGISEPRAYSATCSCDVVTTNENELPNLETRMNQSKTLVINGNSYTGARITDISKSQPRGGGDVWSYSISFQWYMFEKSDIVKIGTTDLSSVLTVGDEKRTAISDDRYQRAGISQPRAYSFSRTIDGILTDDDLLTELMEYQNLVLSVVINETTYTNATIADISTSEPRGGGAKFYSLTITGYVFNSVDSVRIKDLTLPYVLSTSDAKITAITDDRYIKAGISEPMAYSYTRSIDGVLTTQAFEDKLLSLINTSADVIINDKTYSKARIVDVSISEPRGNDVSITGATAKAYTVTISGYVFNSTDHIYMVVGPATAANPVLNFTKILSIGGEQKTPIITESYLQRTIPEPAAFGISRTFECVVNDAEFSRLEGMVGANVITKINAEPEFVYKITNLSRVYLRGGIIDATTPSICSIELKRYHFAKTDTAIFNTTLTLSNPVLPNAMDITPSYSVDMAAGNTITNGVPRISRRFAIECICTTTNEFDTLVSYIGLRADLEINGKTYTACYISSLSALQPRGGGEIWSYTVEFTRDSGVSPVTAYFGYTTSTINGVTIVTAWGTHLPNAMQIVEEPDIIASRVELHSGQITAVLGKSPAKRISMSCMNNVRTEYENLYTKIGLKLTLYIKDNMGTRTYDKMYISSISGTRVNGEGTKAVYSWDITFEQETA